MGAGVWGVWGVAIFIATFGFPEGGDVLNVALGFPSAAYVARL